MSNLTFGADDVPYPELIEPVKEGLFLVQPACYEVLILSEHQGAVGAKLMAA